MVVTTFFLREALTLHSQRFVEPSEQLSTAHCPASAFVARSRHGAGQAWSVDLFGNLSSEPASASAIAELGKRPWPPSSSRLFELVPRSARTGPRARICDAIAFRKVKWKHVLLKVIDESLYSLGTAAALSKVEHCKSKTSRPLYTLPY
jgi:hypothetical protein